MTTYNVTITNNIDFSFNHYNQTAKQVKEIKARYAGNKAMKVTATKIVKTYYRGEEVKYIEERQNGYTLVNSDTKGFIFANTAEITYR